MTQRLRYASAATQDDSDFNECDEDPDEKEGLVLRTNSNSTNTALEDTRVNEMNSLYVKLERGQIKWNNNQKLIITKID